MEAQQTKKLMTACGYFDYGLDKISLLEMSIERDEDFYLEALKQELTELIKRDNFDWVGLAIDSKFVYTSNEVSPKDFDIENLLIFTDNFRWREIVKFDAILSNDQIYELKRQFKEIRVQDFDNINALLDHNKFEWLPFEVKHAYLQNFTRISYTNEDIIYYLKSIVWDYLFPNALDFDRLESLKQNSLLIFENINQNEGWTEMIAVIQELKVDYPDLDLYEISQVNWGENIQHKSHYRNPFTLGFKRIKPLAQSLPSIK